MACAAEVSGVRIDDTASVGGATLVLNGAGKRTRVVFDVYVAGLYLTTKRGTTQAVLDAPGPKRVTMTMMRDLGPDKLIEALQEGIRQNAGAAQLAAIQPQLDALVAGIRSIGPVHKGDVIAIDFLPDGSTQLSLNGTAKGGSHRRRRLPARAARRLARRQTGAVGLEGGATRGIAPRRRWRPAGWPHCRPTRPSHRRPRPTATRSAVRRGTPDPPVRRAPVRRS